MIELRNNQLVLRFPEVHEDAILRVDFQRTLRIPDDDRAYPLPPGLGRFPLRHSEALWVLLSGRYPFAVRVATGKIDAVTGKELRPGLARRPQNYLVVPEQPWLDGYCVEEGVIRQFRTRSALAAASFTWRTPWCGGTSRGRSHLPFRRRRRSTARPGFPGSSSTVRGKSALSGSGILERLRSVVRLGKEKGDVPVPENEWLVGLGWRRHACPRKLRSWNPSARSLTL